MCLRGGTGGGRLCVVPRTISAARQTRPPADDVHHHPGEMSQEKHLCSDWETGRQLFLMPPKVQILFAEVKPKFRTTDIENNKNKNIKMLIKIFILLGLYKFNIYSQHEYLKTVAGQSFNLIVILLTEFLFLFSYRATDKPRPARFYSWHSTSAAWRPSRGGRVWHSPGFWPLASNGATRRLRTSRTYSTWLPGRCPPFRPSPFWPWLKLKVSSVEIPAGLLSIINHQCDLDPVAH